MAPGLHQCCAPLMHSSHAVHPPACRRVTPGCLCELSAARASSCVGTQCPLCRYVTGDYRFKTGFCKSNPRKMVKSWAEKEMRNLMRLHTAGIRCPRPVQLRMHVLVMDFIGADGRAAPRLKVGAWCNLNGSAQSDGECSLGRALPGLTARWHGSSKCVLGTSQCLSACMPVLSCTSSGG